jgi:hypothetical protein
MVNKYAKILFDTNHLNQPSRPVIPYCYDLALLW